MTTTSAPAVGQVSIGDVRAFAEGLGLATVQCMVTSPPYWGLRSYPVPPLVWGGDAACDHRWGDEQRAVWASDLPGPTNPGKNPAPRRRARKSGRWCERCGAWLGQLGGEPTVEAYVAHLVAVFRLLRPGLADDGVLWLNLGDTYAFRSARVGGRRSSSDGRVRRGVPESGERPKAYGSLKHKDLVLVPFRVALALQEDGWYVRGNIVWEKPNALPEAVTDRPSNSHEALFLLTKRPRYYYDKGAIGEPVRGTAHSRGRAVTPKGDGTQGRANNSWQLATAALAETRNARTVWPINTERFPGDHDSTFPSALARRCILAGSRPGDLVCDPFAGTGTVPAVAHAAGRRWVARDLNPQAIAWHRERLAALPVASLFQAAD